MLRIADTAVLIFEQDLLVILVILVIQVSFLLLVFRSASILTTTPYHIHTGLLHPPPSSFILRKEKISTRSLGHARPFRKPIRFSVCVMSGVQLKHDIAHALLKWRNALVGGE